MTWILTVPTPLLLVAGVGVLVLVLRRWPRALLVELAVTAILTLAVLLAMGLAWPALWWGLQRWWA